MTKTKYWLSILAISVVLVAGSLAVSPIAIADDDDDDEVEASIEAELELEQDGEDVELEVEAEGLKPGSYTVRAYGLIVTAVAGNTVGDENTNCMRGTGNALASFTDTVGGDGELEISGTISDEVVTDVNSVSIRSMGSPGSNPPVVCFQDTTP